MAEKSAEKPGRKQTAISLKMKMELLRAVDEKRWSKTEICKDYGIANSTLSTIIKNRDQITAMFERSMFEPERKRMRTAKYEDLEVALLFWYRQVCSPDTPISGPLMLEKAAELAQQMGIEFFANSSWLERFKKRNGIVLKNCPGKAKQVLPTMTTTDWLQSTWLQFTLRSIEEYDAKDVFNVDETGLFYRCLPSQTLSFKGQSCSGGEFSKERITVLVGCNSDGSEKLPLFVIGKNSKPRCFKNVKTLPVEYKANKKSWMVASLFTEWILELDKRFLQEKRKVAVIIDNCPAHPDIKLKAIKLIILPPNITIVLHPCNQGIIQSLKFHYRKQLLRKYLLSVEAKKDFSINLLDALHMLRSAWDLVTPKTIENCFRLAGFSTVAADSTATQHSTDIAVEPTFAEVFEQVSTLLECPTVSLDEFVALDDDICTAPTTTDESVLETVQSSKNSIDLDSDNESDNEVNIALPIPSASEIRNIMKSMRSYLDAHSNGEMNKAMNDIEQFVENLILKNALQKK